MLRRKWGEEEEEILRAFWRTLAAEENTEYLLITNSTPQLLFSGSGRVMPWLLAPFSLFLSLVDLEEQQWIFFFAFGRGWKIRLNSTVLAATFNLIKSIEIVNRRSERCGWSESGSDSRCGSNAQVVCRHTPSGCIQSKNEEEIFGKSNDKKKWT